MLDHTRQSMEAQGVAFPLEEQVQLVNEQLALLDKHCEENGFDSGDEDDDDDEGACEDDEGPEQEVGMSDEVCSATGTPP
mmetsp:Transcript_84882/g.169884  ORF Transcript_84882/g.169884 Transcript_84882/m.169884 type:complete len:80 (+) Transcript_84882:82-321(+)